MGWIISNGSESDETVSSGLLERKSFQPNQYFFTVRLGRWPESNLSHGTLRMSHQLILFLVISRDLTSGLEASLYLYVESVKHLFRPNLILFLVIFFVFIYIFIGFFTYYYSLHV